MYKHPVVKPAFHISWFLLILGGISLFEKGGWGIAGAVLFITGLGILAFTAFSIYLHKPILKQPGWLLLLALAEVLILILVQVLDRRFALALIITIIALPILGGWFKLGKEKQPQKKSNKKKK